MGRTTKRTQFGAKWLWLCWMQSTLLVLRIAVGKREFWERGLYMIDGARNIVGRTEGESSMLIKKLSLKKLLSFNDSAVELRQLDVGEPDSHH